MNFPSRQELNARGTLKYTAYAPDVLPMWVAESDFAINPVITQALHAAVDRAAFGYPPRKPKLIDSFLAYTARAYGWEPEAAHVQAISDVVHGFRVAIDQLTPPDKKVVFSTPAYPPFFNLPRPIDPVPSLDLDVLEEHFAGAGAFLLCHPHNPTGKSFDAAYLQRLNELSHQYDFLIISDEIHAPLSYTHPHIPAATICDKVVTLMAASKAWNIAGLKCAQLISATPVQAVESSTLGMIASSAAYEDQSDFLEQIMIQLKANRDRLLRELPRIFPNIRIECPDATFLLWLDFSRVEQPQLASHPAAALLQEAKVALNDGITFGKDYAAFARFNFACSPQTLDDALQRFSRAYLSL